LIAKAVQKVAVILRDIERAMIWNRGEHDSASLARCSIYDVELNLDLLQALRLEQIEHILAGRCADGEALLPGHLEDALSAISCASHFPC
jgi:hypothetical protein